MRYPDSAGCTKNEEEPCQLRTIVHWHSGWPENRHEPLSLLDSAQSGNDRGARIARRRIASTAGRSGNSLTCAKNAAFHLLRRFGAERCGNSLAISRARLMARLRETQEHPDWRWERERRERIRARIDTLRPNQRRSLVPVGEALQQRIDLISIAGLPDTVRFAAGRLTIHCRDMEHLVEQLVLVAKALDTDYEAMRLRVESAPARPVRYCGHAAARSSSQAG